MRTITILLDALLFFGYILPNLQTSQAFYAIGASVLALAVTVAIFQAR